MQFRSSKVGQTKWEKYMWKLEGKKNKWSHGFYHEHRATDAQYIPEAQYCTDKIKKNLMVWMLLLSRDYSMSHWSN